MTITQNFADQLEQEIPLTRNMLQRINEEYFGWKPHEKSMNLKQLCVHIAEIPGWADLMLNTPGIDFEASGYTPAEANSRQDILDILERSYEKGKTALQQTTDDQLNNTWIMRSGDVVHAEFNKAEAIRHAMSQLIHHRAQLGVYLRLLNIPIPGTYGPSADEIDF